MASAAQFYLDLEDPVLVKGTEGCPKKVHDCSLKEIYYYKYGMHDVHNPQVIENCFVQRVKDQVRGVAMNKYDKVARSHEVPINLSASYLVLLSSEDDNIASNIRRWYYKQFSNAGIPYHSTPPLKIYEKSSLIQTLSTKCKEGLVTKEEMLDAELEAYAASRHK